MQPRSAVAAGVVGSRRQAVVAAAEPLRVAAGAHRREVVAAGTAAAAVAVAGSADKEPRDMKNFEMNIRSAVAVLAFAFSVGAHAQQSFATPEAAAEAFVDALARHDGEALAVVVGAGYRRYVPVASVDPEDVTNFLEAWSRGHRIVPAGPDKAFLGAGVHGWTMPIPIVKSAAGWRFDTSAAPEEMRIRRIGRNEWAAIQVALAYTDAQEEYHARDWNGDGVRQYAQRALSSPGKRDGLYWASLPGEPESPLGPEFADARIGAPYHGYRYRLLTAQGKDAPGGAKSYIRNGRMTEGYALIAWPAKYNDTGVMTFIVNQDGVVYQKNLGPATDQVARAIDAFDPDATWEKVKATR
jgi:hypothetical protein